MSPAWPRVSGSRAPQVSASPGMRLPSQAVTPGHSNHTGQFILLAPASHHFRPRLYFHPELKLLLQELCELLASLRPWEILSKRQGRPPDLEPRPVQAVGLGGRTSRFRRIR